MIFVLQTLSLLLPVLTAGIVLIVVIKCNLLSWLYKPIDGGVKINGQPLFGANKTWRGVVIYIVGSILVCFLLWLGARQGFAWIHPIFEHNSIVVGVLYGASYSTGELINSFVKRRLRIRSGQNTGVIQYVFDTIDGIVLTILILSIFYGANWFQLLLVLIIGSTLHVTTDAVMKRHRLKK